VSRTRSQNAVIAAGLIASALFIYLALRNVDEHAWRDGWRSATPMPYLLYAAGCYLVGQVVRGARLRLLVPGTSLGLLTASSIVVVGYAANNVLPARLGELVRAAALAERTGIAVTQALTVTLVERVLDGLAILLLLIVASSMLPTQPTWMPGLERVSLAVFGTVLVGLVFAVRWPSAMLRMASRAFGRLSPRWRDPLMHVAANVAMGAAPLRDPSRVVLVAATSVLVWVLEAGMFLFALPAVGLTPHASMAALAMGVTNLGILVPSSPGYVGPFHYFCSQALISQGVPNAIALTYATLVHVTFFVPVTVWGVIAMLFFGVRLGALAALAGDARRARAHGTVGDVVAHVVGTMEARPPRAKATRFDVALVEAFVDSDDPPRDSIDEAATFFAGQMALLPWSLSTLYVIGMSFFRVVVRMRYGRSFCALSAKTRRAVVERCAFGGFEPFRQLFRPVRSPSPSSPTTSAPRSSAPSPRPTRALASPSWGAGEDAMTTSAWTSW
jgi:uncharacterized protein (TIRG00374 family)